MMGRVVILQARALDIGTENWRLDERAPRSASSLQRLSVLLRQLGLHAFDVEVHRGQVLGGCDLAIGDAYLAGLVLDRAGEGVEGATADAGDDFLGFGLHFSGYQVADRQADAVLRQAAPEVLGFPAAVDHALRGLRVMRAPVVDDGGQHGLGTEVLHVRGVAHGIDTAAFGSLDRCRAVGVLEDYVHALVDQRVGGIGFLARIEPGVDPDDLDLGARVVLVQRQLDGVDVADDLRNREGGDVADLLGLGHLRREEAADVATLVGAGQVGADVLRLLVAGGVLEGDVGELLGDLDRRVHVTEGGGEDQVIAALGHVADHPFGVGAFGDVLDEAGLNLVAELFFQVLAALLVLVGPAMVADRAAVDETDLQGIGRRDAEGGAQTDGCGEGPQQRFSY